MALGRKDGGGFWVCPSSRTSPARPRPLLDISAINCRPSCLRSSAPAYPPNAPELCELFLRRHLRWEVLLGLQELLLLQQKAQGSPGVPGQQFGKCHVFPQKAKAWRAGLRLVRTQGTPPPTPDTPPPDSGSASPTCAAGRRAAAGHHSRERRRSSDPAAELGLWPADLTH